MTLDLEVQLALEAPGLPDSTQLHQWAEATLDSVEYQGDAELVIRIVNEAESASLNETYRHKQGPTNVLSFPFETPFAAVETNLLGDIVICAPVVNREAVIQNKTIPAHWAHMVIHGVLHLLGYDHQEEHQAEQMELLEIRILQDLGYPNPYGGFD